MEKQFEDPTALNTFTAFTMGTSAPIRELARALARLATADVNVLLHGEAGTGKRLIAQAIHAASPRAASPFVAFSLGVRLEPQVEHELFGANDDGLLAQAIGGTLYLEEIGALPLRLQQRVARALAAPDMRGTIRVIATTTFELEEPLRLGRFLPELYRQLGLIRVTIPPLRERREDLKGLSEYFISGWCERMAVRQPVLSRAALAELAAHAWPGNVRELQQTVEETLALAHGAELTVDRIRRVLGRRSRRQALLGVFPLRTLERDYIASVLVRCGWNQSLAARHLGIGRNTLMRKIRVFKLDRSEAA